MVESEFMTEVYKRVGFRCKDSYFVVNRLSIQNFPIFAVTFATNPK
jgi:hypothetical protein